MYSQHHFKTANQQPKAENLTRVELTTMMENFQAMITLTIIPFTNGGVEDAIPHLIQIDRAINLMLLQQYGAATWQPQHGNILQDPNNAHQN